MRNTHEEIRNNGFALTEFAMSLEDRALLADIGNQIIDLSEQNPKVYESLRFTPKPVQSGRPITTFDVSPPTVSKDKSIWFHSGWQLRDRLSDTLGRNTPGLLLDFLDIQEMTLFQLERGWLEFINSIVPDIKQAEEFKNHIVRSERNSKNQHIRIVRYQDIDQPSEIDGTFSAHSDLSVLTTQFFETHQGYLHIAPSPVNMVAPYVDEERYNHYVSLHEKAQEIYYDPDKEAVTMLGVGSANLEVNGVVPLRDLSIGYHFGHPPDHNRFTLPEDEITDRFGDNVRVAAIGFAHPHYDVQYRAPTKEMARPEQVFTGNVK